MAINILDSVIANRISAGEVVERPASIVKELMDNALDAGATVIDVEIVNGGIDLIAVRDNGCGIAPEDVKKAFLPHATSKISCLEDLDNIATLGFRGEALASISSVSQVSLITKTKDLEYASQINVNGGQFGPISATSSAEGTYLEVRNLFFNTPARRKFLRRPKTEESEITNYISRYILAHPEIKIRYTANEKVVFDNRGGDLLNAIACVYGVDIVPNLEPISYESGYVKIDGYVSKISYTKPNTTYQTLLVNGRYVIDETLSKAVYSAYEEFLMSRQFPFYVINLTLPYSEVDVNVHPNKLNVKFSHPNEMFEIFYRATRQAIYNSLNPSPKDSKNINYSYDDTDKDIVEFNQPNINQTNVYQKPALSQIEQEVEQEVEIIAPKEVLPESKVEVVKLNKFVTERNASIFDKEYIANSLNSIENNQSYQAIEDFCDYKIIGEIFNEFLILEKDNIMLMVDFHAGHERLLYDQLVNKINNEALELQTLLVPYTHTLNIQEIDYIIGIKDSLYKLGFDINQIGANQIEISCVPAMLSDINLKDFVGDLLHDIKNKRPKINAELDNSLMQKACKSAVKAGMTLSESQIKQLLKNLDINKPVLLCPHGRPIVSVITRAQVEKWFKRIV